MIFIRYIFLSSFLAFYRINKRDCYEILSDPFISLSSVMHDLNQ